MFPDPQPLLATDERALTPRESSPWKHAVIQNANAALGERKNTRGRDRTDDCKDVPDDRGTMILNGLLKMR